MTTGLIWGGSTLAVLGIAMLGWCIWRALGIRKMEDKDAAKSQLQTLAAINMAAARRITSREIVEYVTFPSSVRPSLIGMGPVRTAVQRRIR